MVRRSIRDVGLLWLLMFGIGLVFGIVMLPVVLGLLVAAVALGGGVGYLLYAATHSIALAVVTGVPLGLIILIVPAAFVQGIYLVFESSTWTLAYRNLLPRSA